MTPSPDQSGEDPPEPKDEARHADSGRLAEARSTLAAIERAVVGSSRQSNATHRLRFAATINGLFADE